MWHGTHSASIMVNPRLPISSCQTANTGLRSFTSTDFALTVLPACCTMITVWVRISLPINQYFNGNQDSDAIVYLTLANKLIHAYNPGATTIAEEMSGLPGLAASVNSGGIGFDYRLAMGVPDIWIRMVKEIPDETGIWAFSCMNSHTPSGRTCCVLLRIARPGSRGRQNTDIQACRCRDVHLDEHHNTQPDNRPRHCTA